MSFLGVVPSEHSTGKKRLCGRYRRLIEVAKNQKTVCVAIARELIAFVWAVVCDEMDRLRSSRARA
jgi:transposase